MLFSRRSPEEQYRRVLSSCDWLFRLRVKLRDGGLVPGEYSSFSPDGCGALSIWGENGEEIDIPVAEIRDVMPPVNPKIGVF